MADSDNSHVLKPTEMNINKFRRSSVRPSKEDTTPDQFGQTYNSDYDRSKWSGDAPAITRKLHQRSDVDLGPRSLHHTLGPSANQASPGNHFHDGTTSRKLGPLEMDPGNPGNTRPALTIPAAPTGAQIVALLQNFLNVRVI